MAADPGFIFYPGDYLRDTQCLSENVQVAYDRIMCEHMRNICISQQQLKFFTKRLNEDEILELKSVLTETEEGFFIGWVAESINKRRAYSESRRQNRSPKKEEDMNNICSTYVKHMDNEIENENINEIKNRKGGVGEKQKPIKEKQKQELYELPEVLKPIWETWIECKPKKFKNQKSESIAKKELFELCGGDVNLADKIVKKSIANSWSGLFALNEKETPKQGQREVSGSEAMRKRVEEVAKNFLKTQNLNNGSDIPVLEIGSVPGESAI